MAYVTLPPPTSQQRLAERLHPGGTAVMYQRWENLLFLHWRWDAAEVQRRLPAGLAIDTFDGDAWLGLVPIFMRNVRPRFVPKIPFMSEFLELNLRTYAYDAKGRPGIYFFSLDCDQPLVVEGARRLLHLRYEHSVMSGSAVGGDVKLSAQRVGTSAVDHFRYRIYGEPAEAGPDTLEFFLIERYRLFTRLGSELLSIRVSHAPYRIRPVEVGAWGDAAFPNSAFARPGRDPEHFCAAEPVDLEMFVPERVAS